MSLSAHIMCTQSIFWILEGSGGTTSSRHDHSVKIHSANTSFQEEGAGQKRSVHLKYVKVFETYLVGKKGTWNDMQTTGHWPLFEIESCLESHWEERWWCETWSSFTVLQFWPIQPQCDHTGSHVYRPSGNLVEMKVWGNQWSQHSCSHWYKSEISHIGIYWRGTKWAF